jgi:hypothetical protein
MLLVQIKIDFVFQIALYLYQISLKLTLSYSFVLSSHQGHYYLYRAFAMVTYNNLEHQHYQKG